MGASWIQDAFPPIETVVSDQEKVVAQENGCHSIPHERYLWVVKMVAMTNDTAGSECALVPYCGNRGLSSLYRLRLATYYNHYIAKEKLSWKLVATRTEDVTSDYRAMAAWKLKDTRIELKRAMHQLDIVRTVHGELPKGPNLRVNKRHWSSVANLLTSEIIKVLGILRRNGDSLENSEMEFFQQYMSWAKSGP